MSLQWFVTALTGSLVLAAAFFVSLHQILSSPDRPNYPTATRRLRVAMFIWAACLGYRGVEILCGLQGDHPTLMSPAGLATSFMLVVVHGLMLEQQLRLWLPAKWHARIRQLLKIASCRHDPAVRAARTRANAALREGVAPGDASGRGFGPALAELKMAGVAVAAPGEGPGPMLGID